MHTDDANAEKARRLGELIDRHVPALVLYARQWCGCGEDVVQEALAKLAALRVWPDEPKAWLYAAVRRRAISAGRTEARRRRREHAVATQNGRWFESGDGAAHDAEVAQAALAKLAPQQREVIVAHLWGQLGFDQIGELVGCSGPTAWRRYQAGLESLRGTLK